MTFSMTKALNMVSKFITAYSKKKLLSLKGFNLRFDGSGMHHPTPQ